MSRTVAHALFVLVLGACDVDGKDQTLERLEDDAESPTGVLETTDAKALAYTIYGTQRVVDAIASASSELPGLRQSPVFARGDASECARGTMQKLAVDYGCLGYGAGRMTMRARGAYPNDNGDYDLTLTDVHQNGEGAISAKITLHVEGLGDGDLEDKVLFVLDATLAAAPESFATISGPGLVASVEKGGGAVYGLARVQEKTFVFKNLVRTADNHFVYDVRDKKNLWHCDSALSAEHGDTIEASNCRVQEGTGDWAILRF